MRASRKNIGFVQANDRIEYDSHLVQLEECTKDDAGVESTRYDGRGNELEEVQYGSDGTLKEKTKYVYRFDHFGNPIVQEIYEWVEGHRSYQLREVSYFIIQYRR